MFTVDEIKKNKTKQNSYVKLPRFRNECSKNIEIINRISISLFWVAVGAKYKTQVHNIARTGREISTQFGKKFFGNKDVY